MKAYAIIFQILPIKSATLYDAIGIRYGNLNYDELKFTEERKPKQRKENVASYLSIRDERELFDEFYLGKKKVYFYGFPITSDELREKYPGMKLEEARKKYYEEVTSYIYLGGYDPLEQERYYRAVNSLNLEFIKVDFNKPFNASGFQKLENEKQKTKKLKKN